jgi:hypothetical protein
VRTRDVIHGGLHSSGWTTFLLDSIGYLRMSSQLQPSFVLCEYEIWFLTLRKEHELRVSGDQVLRGGIRVREGGIKRALEKTS